jgi:hypothetical protein
MWNFVNMATGHASQRENLAEVFGDDFEEALGEGGQRKQIELMRRYRGKLTREADGGAARRLRTALLPVEYVDRNAIIFHLVYATHAAPGLLVFMEQTEKVTNLQRALKIQHQVRKREQKVGMTDLFADQAPYLPSASFATPDLAALWLELLPTVGHEVRVTDEIMAGLLERGDCSLGDLQLALAELIKEGTVQNLDQQSKRSKHAVKWRRAERLVRLK